MAERRLIFNTKGFQLGYIEGNAVFDLSGRRRCSYTGATGNLGDFDSGKILGHISLDGTFVGASWLSEDLFGKPIGEAHPDRLVKVQGPHSRKVRGAHSRKVQGANTRVERTTTQRPEDLPTKKTPQLAESAAHAETLSKSGGDPEPGLSVADQVSDPPHALPSVSDREDTDGTPGSTTPSPAESEMLSRAIGMIRSALVKKES
jgi:hypothetical protein